MRRGEAVRIGIASLPSKTSCLSQDTRNSGFSAGEFVGRQREMAELRAALEDALSGRGRLVTLMGEPGIGKTRTAQELVARAMAY